MRSASASGRRLCLQVLGVVPVASYVADKLEGIVVLLIMLWLRMTTA